MGDGSGRPGPARLRARRGHLARRSLTQGTPARSERWARFRRYLWQPPRPHGEQPRERVVGPLEL